MALVITPVRQFVTGDRMCLIADVTGDTSYPTNGSVVTLAQLGFNELDSVEPQMPLTGIRTYQYDYTNNKLKAYSAFNTEVTNATNCSADVVRTVFTGKGFAIAGV